MLLKYTSKKKKLTLFFLATPSVSNRLEGGKKWGVGNKNLTNLGTQPRDKSVGGSVPRSGQSQSSTGVGDNGGGTVSWVVAGPWAYLRETEAHQGFGLDCTFLFCS